MSSMPLKEAHTEFLIALRASKPSPHTVRAYTVDLTNIANVLAEHAGQPVEELTTEVLTARRLRAAFAEYADGHAKATVSRAWSTWNRLCDHLVVDGVMDGNPMAAVGRPRASRKAPHAFTEQDMTNLLDVITQGRIPAKYPWPTRDYAAITTLAVTGLRAAEFLSLTLGTVEGAPGQRVVSVIGKGDKHRVVPIDPRLEAVIDTYLQERWSRFGTIKQATSDDPWAAAAPTTPLWVSDKGEPMTVSQLEHLVRRAYRAAGINAHRPPGALIHALRHTFATRLIENGVNAVEVMELLGHASLSTTQRYLATQQQHLRTAVTANPIYSTLEPPPPVPPETADG